MENQNRNQNKKFIDDEDLDLKLEDDLEIEEDKDENLKDLNDLIEEEDSQREEENSEEEESSESDEQGQKINYLKMNLLKIQKQIQQMVDFLEGGAFSKREEGISLKETRELKQTENKEGQKIVEGVFTGEEMIGSDGKRYSIPSNYCSKSKLVEGDMLKLIIEPDGTFVYKQIGPIERDRLVGTLIKDEATNQYYAMVDGDRFKIIRASVTYFKGNVGDEVIILTPQGVKSEWAAVENIIKKS